MTKIQTTYSLFILSILFAGAPELFAQHQASVEESVEGNKVFFRLDSRQLRLDLDSLFLQTAGIQGQIQNLSWAAALESSPDPGMDVNFFGFDAIGIGQVTTTGTFTGDSLVLNKDAAIAGRLNVTDVVTLSDSLLVEGTVVLNDSLRVVKAVSMGSRLHVTGVTAFGDSVHVVGNVDFDALFNVDGAATFGSTLAVTGETTLSDTLHAAAPALFADSVDVGGDLRVAQSASVVGNAAIGGTLGVTGAATLSSTLAVTGVTVLSDSLHVSGSADVDGNFNVDGATTVDGMTVDGALDVNGNGDVSGTLGVGGAASLGSTLAVTGETTLSDTLHAAAPALFADAVDVGGNAAFAGTVQVSGTSTLSAVQVIGALDVNGLADVSGATALGSTLAVTGVATFADTLKASAPGLFADSLDVAGSAHVADVLYADSIVSGKVVNAQVRDLANHTTDGLVESNTNRYFTPFREQALLAELDSLGALIAWQDGLLTNLLNQLFEPAAVTTDSATSVGAFSASLNAVFTTGGAAVEGSGFELSLNSDLSDSTVYEASGAGAFTAAVAGLTKGTGYHYRAFVETIMGRSDGQTTSFTTVDDPSAIGLAVLDAGTSTATLRGLVTGNGGGSVSGAGFKYGTSPNLIGAEDAAVGAAADTFGVAIGGLDLSTTYYYAAYVTNEAATTFSDTLSFETLGPCNGATSLAFDGYDYAIVEIGTQCWFAENLRTAVYANGDTIPDVPTGSWGAAVPSSQGARAAYDNDPEHLAAFGYLYNWVAVNKASGLCPTGWHVPSDGEWNLLTQGIGTDAIGNGAATALKAADPVWDGTNAVGFYALPGGTRAENSSYTGLGTFGQWWTSSRRNATSLGSWSKKISTADGWVSRLDAYHRLGFSVRCMRN